MTAIRRGETSVLVDLLFEDPAAGRCLVAPDGTVLRVNAEWLRATGFDRDEVLGLDLVALFPETRDLTLALHARVRAGHHVAVPRHAQRVHGREAWWEGTIDPVPMVGGTGMLLTMHEVASPSARGRGSRWSDAQGRAIAEHILDHLVVLEAIPGRAPGGIEGWRYVDSNEPAARLLGTTRERLLDRTLDEMLGPRAEAAAERLQRVLESGTPERYESSYDDRDFLITLFRIDARTVGSAALEVTDRRRAEDAQARLAAIIESADAAIVSKDLRGTVLTWNAAAERLLGYPADEIVGRPIDAIIPPDRAHEERAILARVAAGELVPPFETQRLTRSGARVDVSVTVSPIRRRDGRIIGASKILRDVTDRRRSESDRLHAEEALRGAEQRFRSAIENLPSGLIVADLSSRALHWNREALAIHGYTDGEEVHAFLDRLVAEHDLRTLAGEPIAIEEWPLPRLLDGGSFRDYEIRVRNKRLGWERIFSYSGVVVRDPGAPPFGLLAIQDITDRKRAEETLRELNERLREADRRKDEFLGMLSHELRNPLAPVRNALYILDRADPVGPQASRAKEVANRQVGHLTRLVDDLLDVTRIARGKIQLHRADLDLGELVRRTAEDYRPLMAERRIELTVDAPPERLPVDGDETRLAQVLGNLLQNAAKFTPAGGRVDVAVRGDGARAVLRVRDTGAGIDSSLRAAVFEPFTQAKQTLARSEGGLGLGLALVKGLVTMHGGAVSVASEGEGKGAEFVVELPLAPARRVTTRGGGGVPEGARGERRRVLVVDDNHDAAETLAEIVALLGYEVETAFDGPSALERTRGVPPDVVLCDIGLPGMDGYALARALRAARDRGMRIIAVSGYAQPEDLERAAEAGFDGHVAKPPDPAEIGRILAEPVGGHAGQP